MKIVKITLEGFKSYSNRVTIDDFHPEFTAITGANGTGKSNIFDGICFAMGFKPGSEMRVQSIEDLIFRRGQAGVTNAAVTLELDNSDKATSPSMYMECPKIIVTRQIALGGRDRHFINGHVKKPKEVQRMFAEARLSTENPQFLVMQGKITKVINMKPLEILDLFQEAVGTNIFDKERRSSERTLKDKQDQLARIEEDIATSLQPTLDHLRQEKNNYLMWTSLGQEIPTLKYMWLVKRKAQTEQRHGAILSTIETETDKIDTLERDIIVKKNEILEIKDDRRRKREEMDALSSGDLEKIKRRRDPLEKDMLNCQSIINESIKEQTQTTNTLKQAQKDLETIQKQIEDFEASNQSKLKTSNDLEANLETLRTKSEAVKFQIAQFKQGVIVDENGKDIAEQLTEARDELTKTINAKLSELEVQSEAQSQIIADLKPKVKSTGQFEKLQKEKEKLQTKLTSTEAKLNSVEFKPAAHEQLMRDFSNASREAQDVQFKIDQMVQATPDLKLVSEYHNAIPNRDDLPGVVFELFRVKDDCLGFRIALEECAKSRLRHVVVANDQVCQKFLEYMRQHGRRATCMPLTAIHSTPMPENVIKQAKEIGATTGDCAVYPLDCLDLDSENYVPVMRLIFPGTFFCSKRETASKLYNLKGWQYSTITTSGEKWDGSGSISGGSTVGMNNLLKIIDEWQKLVSSQTRISKDLSRLTQAYKESEDLASMVETSQRDIESMKTDLALLTSKIESLASLSDEGKLKQAEQALKELTAQRKELEAAKKTLIKEKIEPLEAIIKQDKEKYLKKLTQECTKVTDKLTSTETKFQEVCKSMEDIRSQQASLRADLNSCKDRIASLQTTLETLNSSIESETEKRDSLKAKIDLIDNQAAGVMDKYKLLEKEYQELTQLRDNHTTEIEQNEAEVAQSKRLITQARQQLNESSQSLKSVTDELSRHPAMDIGSVESKYGECSLEEMAALIDEKSRNRTNLQLKIDKNAVALLSSAETEFEALKQDKLNVEEQRDTVLKFIANIDAEKKKKLQTSFTKVNQLFGQIFSTLLPGSTASLTPVDKNLSKGLEMRVSLNGTKRQTLAELSGGQKSLLALSLVLAMLKLNPSPFYILDEVDAALDLSHTQNLGQMIKRYFSESQFIVVSHKDNLYTNADVLLRTSFANGSSMVTRVTQ